MAASDLNYSRSHAGGWHWSNHRGVPVTQGRSDLSRREIEVLILFARGWDRNEVANKLHIGLSTVKTHCSEVRRKLKAQNIRHAVILALLAGEISLLEILEDPPPCCQE